MNSWLFTSKSDINYATNGNEEVLDNFFLPLHRTPRQWLSMTSSSIKRKTSRSRDERLVTYFFLHFSLQSTLDGAKPSFNAYSGWYDSPRFESWKDCKCMLLKSPIIGRINFLLLSSFSYLSLLYQSVKKTIE